MAGPLGWIRRKVGVDVGWPSKRRLGNTASLASPADGDLVRPCGEVRPARAPLDPLDPDKLPALALAFSGGGFRASLTALGVLRFLADARLLDRVRHVSSVSGGSITNGLFAANYDTLRGKQFAPDALDELVTAPLVSAIADRSFSAALIGGAWRAIGRRATRTDVLMEGLDDWFFHDLLLEDLPAGCQFIINATSLDTGVRFRFERDLLGDYVWGSVSTADTGVPLASAVGCSAAVPGVFAPFKLRGIEFPCAPPRKVHRLVDGGAYDNMGVQALAKLDRYHGPGNHLTVVINAGGLFVTGRVGPLPVIGNLKRTSALLYRQSTAIRRYDLVDRFKAWDDAPADDKPEWGRRGVLAQLTTEMPAGAMRKNPVLVDWLRTYPEPARDTRLRLAQVPTSFGRFQPDLAVALVKRGWWLTATSLALYHPDVVPALPDWRPIASLN